MLRFYSLIGGVLALLSLISVDAKCATESVRPKNILVLIGYADDTEPSARRNFFGVPHFNLIANQTERKIREVLLDHHIEPNSMDEFDEDSLHSAWIVINANANCQGENVGGMNYRFKICREQLELSQQVRDWLTLHLSSMDEVYYIGHSRQGMGFGIGPFVSEYTYKLEIYNAIERGKLRKIVMASCSSEKYYGNAFRDLGIDFVGSSNASLEWPSESLPFLLKALMGAIETVSTLSGS